MKDQLPDLKNPLPMPAVKSPKTEAISTNEIEKTRRALYGCLDRIRRAGKHRKLTAEFEERLEEHLEELRQEAAREYQLRRSAMQRIEEHVEKFSKLLEERDQIQQRLHAIDHAYNEQQKSMGIAGEELIRVQGIARQHLDEISAVRTQHDILSDAYEHQKQLTRAACVAERESWVQIRELTGLVTNQRQAIADMHMAGRSAKSAIATLQRLGYADCGGQLWKPPLGKKPEFVKDHCETCEGLGYVHCNGGRPTAPCPEGCQ